MNTRAIRAGILLGARSFRLMITARSWSSRKIRAKQVIISIKAIIKGIINIPSINKQ
jgi:hypothetical protein